MYENSNYLINEPITLKIKDKQKCGFIANIIMLQCIAVCIGSTSILTCVWTPEHSTWDIDKLARIMYLYDPAACGYNLRSAKLVKNLQLSNETFGLNILPIKWLPVPTTVSTKLSAKTRRYIKLSCAFHVIWFFLAVTFRIIIKNSSDAKTLKVALAIFLYSCISMIIFDFSMALVYVTNIKQSLTQGMILRYSGWSSELKLDNYKDFAGWLPIAAAVCWLRGIVLFMMNLYFCRVLNFIRRKIRSREIKMKFYNEQYHPFPEAQQVQTVGNNVLVYRVGEHKPQI